ncbi:terminase large subunit [Pikeienuella sp. HZG-20]|uniref:terminase large subunit n=1 Tax=Paludibacillus litoralis TaxID=3133267 RepID=UPI0030EB175B
MNEARLGHVAAAHEYASAVASGEIPAGRWVVLAAKRHLADMARAEAGWRFAFDPVRAQRVCNVIETLPHVKGEWAARGELLRLTPWMSFIVCSIYGWVERETRLRRFRSAYIEMARKNAKSTLLGGLCLNALGFDGEIGAEVYSAAASKDQARVVFDIARLMAAKTPALEQRRGIVVKKHSIAQDSTNSVFEPLASQTKTLDGKSPHFACLDELHAHKDRSVHDVLDSGMGARAQPLLISITTAGYNTAGVCFEIHRDVKRMLDAVGGEDESDKTDRLFGIIYAADEGDDPADPATWSKANPNLGVSIQMEYLQTAWDKAERNPAQMGEFLRKHLCVWTSVGAAAFDLDSWAAGRDEDLDLAAFTGLDQVIVGLDGSKSEDFTSLVVVGFRGDEVLLWDEHWATGDVIHREGNEHLSGWVASGWLHECPGALIELEDFEARVEEIGKLLGAAEIAYDPQYLLQMAQRLSRRGMTMVEQRQNTLSLDPGFRWAQGLIRDRKVRHRGNPVMSWMVGNTIAQASRSGEFIHPAKIGPQDKIDGVQAWLTAMARLEQPEEEAGPSIYETRGLLVA